MTLTQFVVVSFAVYAVVRVITGGYILEGFRKWVHARLWFPYPFFECRLCVGFWVSLAAWLWFSWGWGDVLDLLAVYGASYFLACREIPLEGSGG